MSLLSSLVFHAVLKRAPTIVESQVRNAASLKTVKTRMKTVASIGKITKAMKTVAASKLRHDERRLSTGLPFTSGVLNLFSRLPVEKVPVSNPLLIIGLTSDRGLCGAVNTSVVRAVKGLITEHESQGKQVKYMGIGAKGTTALKRLYGSRFAYSFEDVQKANWTFPVACSIAQRISEVNPGSIIMVNNHFKSAVAFATQKTRLLTTNEIKSFDKAEWSKAMDTYNFEPSVFEAIKDLHEFYLACTLFSAMLDNIASEQSARMAAMDAASKNAREMLDRLVLQYNKARQAAITTELCEIISGATAL